MKKRQKIIIIFILSTVILIELFVYAIPLCFDFAKKWHIPTVAFKLDFRSTLRSKRLSKIKAPLGINPCNLKAEGYKSRKNLGLKSSQPKVELEKLAVELFSRGRFNESVDTYKKSLEPNPKNMTSLLGLGHVLRYLGRYEESEKYFLQALKLKPDDDWIYIEMGKLYRNWEKHDKAEAMFKIALEKNPKNDAAYSYGLGYLYRDMGRLDEALKSFEKAYSINPDSVTNIMGLGDIHRDMKNYAASEEMFKKAISLDQKSEAYMGLGYLYLNMGRLEEAEKSFKDFLEKVRPKSEVYNGLGYIYLDQNKLNQAEEMFKKSLKINPKLFGYLGLAKVYLKKGDRKRAKESLLKSLKNNPNDQETIDLLKKL